MEKWRMGIEKYLYYWVLLVPMRYINCGERTVQKKYRIVITDIAKEYGIGEGDRVEVFIKKIDKKD
jgi:hypothetical protein